MIYIGEQCSSQIGTPVVRRAAQLAGSQDGQQQSVRLAVRILVCLCHNLPSAGRQVLQPRALLHPIKAPWVI